MSQSTSWVENLIFACAPLGIITAIVAAIRVGGAGSLQAIIGRARESRGVVEVELMSSTSADVCELWDGEGVVRVLGSSPIIELYYLQSDSRGTLNSGVMGDDEIPLITHDREDMGIWSFKSALSTGRLRNKKSPESPWDHHVVPNIGLNLSGQRVSNLEFMLFAVVGVVLQAGVVVFAGVVTYLSSWNKRFERDDKPVQKHAFPAMAGGTVALVIGMFLCCYIVERSTTENTWVITKQDGHRVRVAWLQKGGEVNDQHFKSYIIHRHHPNHSKFLKVMRKFINISSNSDTGLPIRTSHRNPTREQGPLAVLAVAVSLVGFVLQFVGLRALAWHVTIAQLVATGAMTGLRAALRRNLAHEPDQEEIKVGGYELEAMAMKIGGCDHWDVTAWKPSPDSSPASEPTPPAGGSGAAPRESRIASKVMDSRRRLGALSMWPSGCQMTAEIVAQAIEASMEFLWTSPDVHLSDTQPTNMFEWKLFVEVSKTRGGRGNPIDTFVQLRVSREELPNGAWGPWKAVRNELEAVLGLWIYHLKSKTKPESPPQDLESNWREDEQAMRTSKNYRIVGNGDLSKKADYRKWLFPQTELVLADLTGEETTIGRPNPHQDQYLAALSKTPLEKICGQHILSTFLADVVHRAVDSIDGKVRVQGSEHATGLRNTVIDELRNEVERTGLATPEDALLCIVPALPAKYFTGAATTEVFPDLAEEISTYLREGRFGRAETLLLWLLDATASDAKHREYEQKWRGACKSYFLLLKTYTGIGSNLKSYERRTEEAIELFCERFHSSHQTKGEDAKEKTLKLVEEVSREMGVSSGGEIGQRWERRRERGEQARDSATSQGAHKAAADGGYHGVMSALKEAADINSHDAMERTALMLACRSGHANIAMQLLRLNADPCLKDRYGKTAFHYAARKNDTSALHALLLDEKAGAVINVHDQGGKSPLKLAIESEAGAAVALLIFYGAQDPEGTGKKLLKLSARVSYAAVNGVLGNNSKDSEYGRTPLHWAVWRGVAVMGSRFWDNDEVEAIGKDGLTALHLAAGSGFSSAVRFLIRELRAEVNAETSDGETALHLSCAGGHDSTVELLVQQLDADVKAETKDGKTALHLACAGGWDSTIQLLIRRFKAEISRGSSRETALNLLVRYMYVPLR